MWKVALAAGRHGNPLLETSEILDAKSVSVLGLGFGQGLHIPRKYRAHWVTVYRQLRGGRVYVWETAPYRQAELAVWEFRLLPRI